MLVGPVTTLPTYFHRTAVPRTPVIWPDYELHHTIPQRRCEQVFVPHTHVPLTVCLSVPLVRAMLFRTVTSDRISIALSSRTRIDVQSLPWQHNCRPLFSSSRSDCTAPHHRALFTGSPCLYLPTAIFIRAFNHCFLPIHSPVSVIRRVFRPVGGFTAHVCGYIQPLGLIVASHAP